MKPMKISIVIFIIFVLMGLMGFNLACSCTEGFGVPTALGASLSWKTGNGLPEDWTRPRVQNHSLYTGTSVPLPQNEMFIFADNKSSPGCCPSSYSTSNGCVCSTTDQIKYVNQRGGNRTIEDGF